MSARERATTAISALSFSVPAGGASSVRTAGPGAWLAVPYPGRAGRGLRWLVPPDGRGTLNDPVMLELAMHEAAALLTGESDEV